MPPPKAVEARYGTLHNVSMAVVAVLMVAIAVSHFVAHPDNAPTFSIGDQRFVLFTALAIAMLTYSWIGVRRALNRQPQIVIDRDGIALASVVTGVSAGVKSSGCACAASPSGPSCRSGSCPRHSWPPTSGSRCGTSTTGCDRSAACRLPYW